jgi:predicted enzyme related to lactoylglutathione lyase
MATKLTHAPGTFCWPELSTTDQRAAEKFYSGVFGWTIQETPMGPDAHYTVFLKDGQDVAAATTINAEQAKMGVPPNWLSYVSTASVDDSVAKARTAGATLLAGPFDVMELGRMAVLADPTGAAFALWQGKTHGGISLFGATGSLVWTELVTPDVAKSTAFYSTLFGWTAEPMPMPDFTYTVMKRGADSAGGVMPLQAHMGKVPPHWMPYFAVDDVDATVARALSLGGTVCAPAMDIQDVGRMAILTDGQNASFAILKPSPRQA